MPNDQKQQQNSQYQLRRQEAFTQSTSSSLTINVNARNAAGHKSTAQASEAKRAPERDGKLQQVLDCLDEQLEDVSALHFTHKRSTS